MSNTQPIKPDSAAPAPAPAAPPPSTDGTLTVTPHVVAVIAGAFVGWLSMQLHLPAAWAPYVTLGLTTLMTTGVHFVQAKIDE